MLLVVVPALCLVFLAKRERMDLQPKPGDDLN
jgi:hypothetical protein